MENFPGLLPVVRISWPYGRQHFPASSKEARTRQQGPMLTLDAVVGELRVGKEEAPVLLHFEDFGFWSCDKHACDLASAQANDVYERGVEEVTHAVDRGL